MKKLLFLLIFIPSILSAQTSFSVRAGDSGLKGLLGVDLQVNNFSVSAGWMPASVPPYMYHVDCYSFSGTYYFFPFVTSPYISAGYTTKGAYYITPFENNTEISPSVIIMGGIRTYPHFVAPRVTDRLSFDIGAGVNFSENLTCVCMEFVINFALFKIR
jgi:hypothetical protein